jgi:hypothetical protein
MLSRKTKVVATLGMTLALGAPTSAMGMASLYSWQGSDYSLNASSGYGIYACDQENDGNDVSADWVQSGGTTEYHLVDNYGNGCSYSGTGYMYRHRAVELLPGTDAYGPWVYPS